MSENTDVVNHLSEKIVDHFTGTFVEGFKTMMSVAEYGKVMFDAFGSAFLKEHMYDMYESGDITLDNFSAYSLKLNEKMYHGIKLNYDIIAKSVEKTTALGSDIDEYVTKHSMIKLKEYYGGQCQNVTKIQKSFDDELKKNNIVKPTAQYKSNTQPVNQKVNPNVNSHSETQIKDNQTDISNVKLNDSKSSSSLSENVTLIGKNMIEFGILTGKEDISKVGTGIIGGASAIAGSLAFCGIGPAILVSANPLGLSLMVLSGINTLVGALKKVPKNNTLEQYMVSLANLMNTIRTEMHERFNQMLKVLRSQEQTYLNNFCKIDSKVDSVYDFLKVADIKLDNIQGTLNTMSKIFDERFDGIMKSISLSTVIPEKEKVIKTIKELRMDTKDHFDENMRNLIVHANTVNELLSGFSDVRSDIILQRFNKLPFEFNVNTVTSIVNSVLPNTIMSSDMIIEWCGKNNVPFVYTGCVPKSVLQKMIKDNKYVLINNLSYWSMFETNSVKNVVYYYGLDSDYLKNVLMNDIKALFVKSSETEYNDISMDCIINNLNMQYDTFYLKQIDPIQNPIFMSLFLNIIMEKIVSQQIDNSDVYPNGFISNDMYLELTKLIPTIDKYNNLVSACRNLDMYKKMFITYEDKKKSLIQTIGLRKSYHYKLYEQTGVAKFMKYYREQTLLLLDQYKNQQIPIRHDYFTDSWFSGNNNHYAGKFAGHDSWSATYAHARDGMQHSYCNNYVSHMTSQIDSIKETEMQKIRESLSKQVNITVCHDYQFTVPKVFSRFIIPLDNTSDLPILTVTDEMEKFINTNNYYLAQICDNACEIKFKYTINDKTNKFVIYAVINNSNVYTYETDYTPLFYTGKEAVFWFWYGGNISLDGSCTYAQRGNSYTDNRSTTTVYFPTYTTLSPHKIVTKPTQWYTSYSRYMTYGSIYLTTFQNMIIENNKKMINDIELKSALNAFDTEANKIVTVSNIGNVSIDVKNSQFLIELINKNDEQAIKKFQDEKQPDIIINPNVNSWFDFADTKFRFCKLLQEICNYVTGRFSASDKLKFHKDMSTTLLKIIDVVQNNSESLKGFDVFDFVSNVSKTFDEKIEKGEQVHFDQHLKESLLMLPNYNPIMLRIC